MYTLTDYMWFFMIYALIGWCMEVAYAAIDRGVFSNRGFLNGPLCPIYGVGMVIVIFALTPISGNVFLLFIGAMILASLLELITGFVLEKLFHTKWWDYSDKPFNIKGYICLKFSIGWGIGGVFIMRIVQPLVYKFVLYVPKKPGRIALVLYTILFICDVSVTVGQMIKLKISLLAMERIVKRLKELSNAMGEEIYDGVMKSEQNYNKSRDELLEAYSKYVENGYIKNNRFMRAFPNYKNMITEKSKSFMDKVAESNKKFMDFMAENIDNKEKDN